MPLEIHTHISNSQHPGLHAIDERLKDLLEKKPARSLAEVADHLLVHGKELAERRLLDWNRLRIELFKVKSQEWNVLLIQYRRTPWLYHTEVVLVPDQMILAL